MRYLMRDGAPLTGGQWEQIDGAVVAEAAKTLCARRLLDVKIVGAHVQSVHLDATDAADAASADFWGREDAAPAAVGGRKFVEIPAIYADFAISWRDIENERGAGVSPARAAAVLAAKREDELVFHGDKKLGIDGIFTVKGVYEHPIADWSQGENALADLAKCIEVLLDRGNAGERALILSTDLHARLHRIQPGTGVMEFDRVKSLVGKALPSARLQKNTACLVYCDARNIDLVIGQDLITAYMGNEKLDHVFRVLETALPRIKRPQAIAVLR